MSDTAVFEWKLPGRPAHAPGPTRRVNPITWENLRRFPVIRIPVTPENRSRLRALRAREVELWGDAPTPVAPLPMPGKKPTASDREARVLLAMLGIGLVAAIVPWTPVVQAMVRIADQLRAWGLAWLG